MTKPNGLHHLAITTADIKTQIAFFSDVLGTELGRSIGCTASRVPGTAS